MKCMRNQSFKGKFCCLYFNSCTLISLDFDRKMNQFSFGKPEQGLLTFYNHLQQQRALLSNTEDTELELSEERCGRIEEKSPEGMLERDSSLLRNQERSAEDGQRVNSFLKNTIPPKHLRNTIQKHSRFNGDRIKPAAIDREDNEYPFEQDQPFENKIEKNEEESIFDKQKIIENNSPCKQFSYLSYKQLLVNYKFANRIITKDNPKTSSDASSLQPTNGFSEGCPKQKLPLDSPDSFSQLQREILRTTKFPLQHSPIPRITTIKNRTASTKDPISSHLRTTSDQKLNIIIQPKENSARQQRERLNTQDLKGKLKTLTVRNSKIAVNLPVLNKFDEKKAQSYLKEIQCPKRSMMNLRSLTENYKIMVNKVNNQFSSQGIIKAQHGLVKGNSNLGIKGQKGRANKKIMNMVTWERPVYVKSLAKIDMNSPEYDHSVLGWNQLKQRFLESIILRQGKDKLSWMNS